MEILLIIIGMALVTYIPRLLPVFIVERFTLPDWVERWLKCVPYAALAALIFPAILTVNEQRPLIGLIGGLVAIILAYLRFNILIVILSSIIVVLVIT